jgi:dTDP-4-dehydrorhamnose reductase
MTVSILVTGASGYLGQHLLHSFVTDPSWEEELEVTAVCNTKSSELRNALFGSDSLAKGKEPSRAGRARVCIESLDFTDGRQVERFLKNRTFDACIHAGAMSSPRKCHDDPEQARAVNVPKVFLKALHQKHVRTIAISTDQVYAGDHPPYIEADSPRPKNVYAETKVELENYLLSMTTDGESSIVHSASVPHVVLRSSIILGPLAPFLPTITHDTFLHFCASRRDLSTVFFVDERRSVVHVRDVISAIRWVIRNTSVRGVFNVGGPHGVSRYDMAKAVFEHLGYNTDCIVARTKASAPEEYCVSPLDITMDIELLRTRSGITLTPLNDIVTATFR